MIEAQHRVKLKTRFVTGCKIALYLYDLRIFEAQCLICLLLLLLFIGDYDRYVNVQNVPLKC